MRVLDLVRRSGRKIFLQLGVGDRDALGITEQLEIFQGEFFHLVRGVARLEVRP
jgi:hypothetical protein